MDADRLIRKSIKGMMWSYISTFTNAFCNILFAAILARLIAPDAFGLFAMAQIVMRFGQYFAQMGLGSAVVQKPELTNTDVKTAWTLVLTVSMIAFGALWFASPLAAIYFQELEVVPVIRIAAVALVLQTVATIPLSLIRRRMDFRRYSLIEVGSYIIGYGGAGIFCAVQGLGVWSLVVAQIAQSALQILISWPIAKCPFLPGWRSDSARRLLSFGGRVSIISFLEFISANLDTLLVGRFLGTNMLGYYNRGKMLPQLPLYYTSVSLNRVLFPLFSQMNADTDRQVDIFRKGLFSLSMLLIPAAAAMSWFSPLAVQILLGDGWEPAVPVVGICAMAVLFALLSSPLAILCEARALLNRKILVQIVRISSMLAFFWLLMDRGISGMAYAYLLCNIFGFCTYLLVAKNQVKAGLILSAMLPGVLVAASASIGVWCVSMVEVSSKWGIWSIQIIGFIAFGAACLFSRPLKPSRDELVRLFVNFKHQMMFKN